MSRHFDSVGNGRAEDVDDQGVVETQGACVGEATVGGQKAVRLEVEVVHRQIGN